MTTKTRFVSTLALGGLMAAPMLAGCGMRGGLARPDPVFRDLTPDEAAAPDPELAEKETVSPRVNEFGGDIPEAAPTDPVQSAPLDETAPEDTQE